MFQQETCHIIWKVMSQEETCHKNLNENCYYNKIYMSYYKIIYKHKIRYQEDTASFKVPIECIRLISQEGSFQTKKVWNCFQEVEILKKTSHEYIKS